MRILLALLVLGLMAGPAFAGGARDTGASGIMPDRAMEVYQSRIDHKIASLDEIVGADEQISKNPAEFPNTYCEMVKDRSKADFYKEERDRLAREMAKDQIEPKSYQVDYFLLSKYNQVHPEQLTACVGPGTTG